MILPAINVDNKVLQLKPKKDQDAKRRIMKSPMEAGRVGSSCKHKTLIVDESRAEVECEECGVLLNPMWVLKEFMRIESRYRQRLAEVEKQFNDTADKLRCKCQHCGKMTGIGR